MRITIGGTPGTGKSTVGRMLADHYGYAFISGGDLFRRAAAERGLTMEQFDELTKNDPSARVDEEIDAIQQRMSREDDNFVLESRLAWHFVPNSIKVKLDCDLDERIKRIAEDTSPTRLAYTQDAFAETKEKTLKRFADHQAKIAEMYGIDDMVADEHFDLVVDTTHIPIEEVSNRIIHWIEEHYDKH